MIQSIEAIIERDGSIHLGEIIKLEKPHRAIVTILEEASVEEVSLLSEQALAEDWLKPEEDEAWAHLQ